MPKRTHLGLVAVLVLLFFIGFLTLLGGVLNLLVPTQPGIGIRLLGVIFLCAAVIEIAIAVGLMQMRKWAHGAGIAISLVNAVFFIDGAWNTYRTMTGPMGHRVIMENVVWEYAALGLFSGLAFIYLLLPKTRRFFQPDKSA